MRRERAFCDACGAEIVYGIGRDGDYAKKAFDLESILEVANGVGKQSTVVSFNLMGLDVCVGCLRSALSIICEYLGEFDENFGIRQPHEKQDKPSVEKKCANKKKRERKF